MGRITAFVSDENCDSELVRSILNQYSIPFQEINLDNFPGRRLDMINLTNNLTTPQVFFNEKHIGGAKALISLLKSYDQEAEMISDFPSVKERVVMEVLKGEMSPSEEIILRIPNAKFIKSHPSQHFERTKVHDIVHISQGRQSTVGVITRELMKWLPRYKTNRFIASLSCGKSRKLLPGCKNYFRGGDVIHAFKNHYKFPSIDTAVKFGQKVLRLGILHRAERNHIASNIFDKNGYFHLQSLSHSSTILNVFRIWTSESGFDELYPDPKPFLTVSQLFQQISCIITSATNETGSVDYDGVRNNSEFRHFEESVCQLQLIELHDMNEEERKTFFINIYNIMMMHGLVKLHPKEVNSHFMANVSYKIGGFLFSLNDIYHGILRGNSAHPNLNIKMLQKVDPRDLFSLRQVDPRVHFALHNNVENQTSAILYHKETIEEELCLTAKLFFESNERVYISDNEIVLPTIMSTYISDFTVTREPRDLLLTILKYLSKGRRVLLRKVLQKGKENVTVQFQSKSRDTRSRNKISTLQKKFKESKHNEIWNRRQKQKGNKNKLKSKLPSNPEYHELREVRTLSTQENSSSDEEKSPLRYIALQKIQSEASNLTTPTMDGAMTVASQFSLSDIRDDYSVDNKSSRSRSSLAVHPSVNVLDTKLDNPCFEDIFYS